MTHFYAQSIYPQTILEDRRISPRYPSTLPPTSPMDMVDPTVDTKKMEMVDPTVDRKKMMTADPTVDTKKRMTVNPTVARAGLACCQKFRPTRLL